MAQIKTKNSVTGASVPGNGTLEQGELAVNITDGKLWVGDASGNPKSLLAGSVGDPIDPGSDDQTLRWNNGKWEANSHLSVNDAGVISGNGSGLTLVNASTLNGNNAAFYRDASNLNAGVLANARVQQSNVTQHQAAINAGQVDGLSLKVDSGSPSGSDPNTIYFVT